MGSCKSVPWSTVDARGAKAAATVLCSPDLFVEIAAYQRGVYDDMVSWVGLFQSGRFLVDIVRLDFADVAAAVKAWHDQHHTSRLRKLVSCMPRHAVDNVFVWAAAFGYLDIVAWFVDHHTCHNVEDAIDEAVARGKVDVVDYLANRSVAIDSRCGRRWAQAAARGHLAMVQWLHAHHVGGCTSSAMDNAACFGRLAIVQWLHAHRGEGCSTDAMDFAATNGHLDVVQWLHLHRTEGCTSAAMDGAAANGYLEVVRFLHHHRHEGWTRRVIKKALQNGHDEVVKFLESVDSHRWDVGAAAIDGEARVA